MKQRVVITMSKKLIQINTVCNTSTGRIMKDIQKKADENGYETWSFVGRRKIFDELKCEKYGNFISFWLHVALTTALDRQGYGSYFVTKKLIQRLKEINPDIIHLHNLHGYYLHLPLLFSYLTKDFQGKLFWTFHDCWPFTGHCAYYTAVKCNKWQIECRHCPNKMQYPTSLWLDNSKKNYRSKKEMFANLKNLIIIVPSEWMAEQVKKSFMSHYDVVVVNNGINLNLFSYQPNKKILADYKIPSNKKILLGVANVWEKRKGLKDFLELSKNLNCRYQIVLVGLTKNQIKKLPANIIGLERTKSQEELAALYSCAAIFINPSQEESFSLVTVEAIACGTPVIVLDTSAVKELVCEENGIVIKKRNIENYLHAIEQIEKMNFSKESIANTAKKYETNVMLQKIMKLYEREGI